MEFFNHIHCVYTGAKGFVKLYEDALRCRYMITEKALKKARILAFWEKHGLEATMEAFQVNRRVLFNWKKRLKEAGGKFEGLNDKSRAPQRRRKRLWSLEIIAEINQRLGRTKNVPSENLPFWKNQES